ncbi:TetR/AcrR family transcriptional regulator [Antarctobacter heliothermus]|uniref:Transcriptional regulator, TetR family n=1 Tax=Antarctobacter heliothermus TaxID=74033 RepID=A0A239JHT6_9RHOB|nr:TetR/AcrR family transcriptional regulator [Antarctobacter heliothermus]SNT05395.1 transcriptional regulator, TetR family [Antarctobacter heliothermus]
MTPVPQKRGPGRPRSFDNAAALESATRCFWSRGYARATMGVLSREMSVPRASLYAHFGDKDGLFLLAIDHYARSRSAKALAHLTGQGDAFAEVSRFFDAAITLVTSDPATPGCLIACVLSEAATADQRFQEVLVGKTQKLEQRLSTCLRASDAGLPEDEIRARAGILAATVRGLAISARAGIPADTLRETASMAARLTCGNAQSW